MSDPYYSTKTKYNSFLKDLRRKTVVLLWNLNLTAERLHNHCLRIIQNPYCQAHNNVLEIFILCIKIMHVWILRGHFFLSLWRFQVCTVLALCVDYFLTLHESCDRLRPVSKLSMCCWSWEATRGSFCCPSGLVSAWWHKGRVATVCCAQSAHVFHCSRTFPAIVKMVQQFPLIRGFIFCRFSYPVRKY